MDIFLVTTLIFCMNCLVAAAMIVIDFAGITADCDLQKDSLDILAPVAIFKHGVDSPMEPIVSGSKAAIAVANSLN